MESPASPEKQMQLNTLRQKQFWTASCISAILYTHGLIVGSEEGAYIGYTGVIITGMIALIHRVGNDEILNELARVERKSK